MDEYLNIYEYLLWIFGHKHMFYRKATTQVNWKVVHFIPQKKREQILLAISEVVKKDALEICT